MNNNKGLTKFWLATIFIWAALAPAASAQLAGHNVLLMHGFIADDLIKPPSREEVLNRRRLSDFWQARAEGFLNWSGADRIEGGIAEVVYEQALAHARRGLCDQGCVLVTHSTGDLVARYYMENQEVWLRNAGYAPLKIIATIDYAGAGGGTDLADVAVAAANSEAIPDVMKWAAGAVIGMNLDVTDYDQLGVVLDLQTSAARNLATAPTATPRLRFSVNGGDLLELGMGQVRAITKTIIRGADDTVVPAHSSCGASAPDAIESCSAHVAYDGKREREFGPRGLLHNHYPVLMAGDYDHFDITQDQHRGLATFVFNDFNAGLKVDFNTFTRSVTRRWWQFWKETGTWQYVSGSDRQSLTRLIYNTFNQ